MTNIKNKKREGKKIGYARVSTADQSVQMQINALVKAGVDIDNIFSENKSGARRNRPALAKAMRAALPGDTLVVWKLDRIARSMRDFLNILEELESKGVEFRSITDRIETDSPGGRFLVHIMSAAAEFERSIGVERTRAGVKEAKERGVKFGADYKIKPKDIPKIWSAVNEQGKTMKSQADKYGVVTATIKRRLVEYEKSLTTKKK